MFINLIDTNLQDRIANVENYDFDIKNALEMLLEKGPLTLQQDLEDWKLEKHNNKNFYFIKTRTTFQMICPGMWNLSTVQN